MEIRSKKAKVLVTDPSGSIVDLHGYLNIKDITVKEVYFDAQEFEKLRTVGDKIVVRFKSKKEDEWEFLNLILDGKEAARLAGRLNYELVMYGVKDDD